jgi:hypothetical protein
MASETIKQVRAFEEQIVCDVCGRTMLTGERPEPYLAPSRERKLVCQLCAPRAQQEGWIRESANPATPAQPPRPRERRRLFKRRRAPLPGEEPESATAPAAPEAGDEAVRRPRILPRRPRDPRHVRAVPTNAQLKVERAVALFNSSEHPRTVAGIARTLGEPRVNATPSRSSQAEVILTVAWDISWYQFAVDLSDSRGPVRMEGRGAEVGELADELRRWNASTGPDGTILLDAAQDSDGEAGNSAL